VSPRLPAYAAQKAAGKQSQLPPFELRHQGFGLVLLAAVSAMWQAAARVEHRQAVEMKAFGNLLHRQPGKDSVF